jgi:uncharacterized DUF497 family protein
MSIDIEFDSEKDAVNRAKHGLPLSFAALLFESDYKEKIDDRQEYGETRIIVIGLIAERLCVCAYTWRKNVRRIISLRKANQREIDDYYKN